MAPTLKIPVHTFGKTTVETMDVSSDLVGTASPLLLTQAVVTGRKRSRIRRAHTKDRAEVRGGGKKPWKQKGTGRARHASIRSPIWSGGGITFGPRTRHEYPGKLSRVMKRKSLVAAFTNHVEDGTAIVVRFVGDDTQKTKESVKNLRTSKLHRPGQSTLMILSADHKRFARSFRNIPSLTVMADAAVSAEDLIAAEYIVIDENSLTSLQKRSSRTPQ